MRYVFSHLSKCEKNSCLWTRLMADSSKYFKRTSSFLSLHDVHCCQHQPQRQATWLTEHYQTHWFHNCFWHYILNYFFHHPSEVRKLICTLSGVRYPQNNLNPGGKKQTATWELWIKDLGILVYGQTQTITLLSCPSFGQAGRKPAECGKLAVPLLSPITTAKVPYLTA